MRKLGITPPPLNEAYKPLSRAYLHPSKVGVASHTEDLYSSAGEHTVLYSHGGIDDILQTRSAILYALIFTYCTICFLWVEMYPVNKNTNSQWYERLVKARKRISSLETRVVQETFNYLMEQGMTTRKILGDYFKML